MLSGVHAIPHILYYRRRGVSKFVNHKELHFKLKANCGSQCGILTDCFGSYCILLVFVNCSDFVPQGNINISLLIGLYFPPNWLIFPSKLGTSGNITLGMPFILWLPMIQGGIEYYISSKVTAPQDAQRRLVLQVYLASNTLVFSAIRR